MGDAPAPSCGGDDDEWEICNDNGFVYKRRRRLRPPEEAAEGRSPADDSEAELKRHRRSRRRRCLLDLRDRYRRELEQWERLSSSPPDLTPAPPSAAAAAAASASSSQLEPPSMEPLETQQSFFDDLLSQVEAQESILRKLSEICDYVESLCREKEESLVESLMELPIWGSPRSLLTSLTD